MPTFRVFLRGPTTNPPVWDFTQTVVAASPGAALGLGYSQWMRSVKHVPPLEQCTHTILPART
jgi:hypothetical protein